MVQQLLVGSIAVIASVLVQAVFIGVAVAMLNRLGSWFARGAKIARLITALVCLTLWMLAGLTATAWMWAGVYMALGVFITLEEALYFSTVAFTTLGFGDITLDKDWRLMSGLMAANGLIIFSLSTAFLLEAMRQIDAGASKQET